MYLKEPAKDAVGSSMYLKESANDGLQEAVCLLRSQLTYKRDAAAVLCVTWHAVAPNSAGVLWHRTTGWKCAILFCVRFLNAATETAFFLVWLTFGLRLWKS
jgi:hypothetical protein